MDHDYLRILAQQAVRRLGGRLFYEERYYCRGIPKPQEPLSALLTIFEKGPEQQPFGVFYLG